MFNKSFVLLVITTVIGTVVAQFVIDYLKTSKAAKNFTI